ncbi:MAG: hypothetical protein ACE5I5_04435 [Candidatus Heimdallarchaeota archaeon]
MKGKKILQLTSIILLAACSLILVIGSVAAEPFETFNVEVSGQVDDGIKFIVEGYQVQFAVAINSSSRYESYSSQTNNITTVTIWARDPGSYVIALTYVVSGPTNLTIIHRNQAEGRMGIGLNDIELATFQRTGMGVDLEYMAVVNLSATGEPTTGNDEPDTSAIVEKTVSLISLLPIHQFILAVFFLVPFPMGLVAYRMTLPDKKARNLPHENVKYRLYSTYLRWLFFLNLSTPIILLIQGTFTGQFVLGFVVFQAIIFGTSVLMQRKARNIDFDYEERMLMKGYPPPEEKDIDLGEIEEGDRRGTEES